MVISITDLLLTAQHGWFRWKGFSDPRWPCYDEVTNKFNRVIPVNSSVDSFLAPHTYIDSFIVASSHRPLTEHTLERISSSNNTSDSLYSPLEPQKYTTRPIIHHGRP